MPADDLPEPGSFATHKDPWPPFDSPETEARFRAGVKAGQDDVAAGRVVSGKSVIAWMRSWFTENELPPPECGD